MKYRTKSVEVEAIRRTDENDEDVVKFIDGKVLINWVFIGAGGCMRMLRMPQMDGTRANVFVGDWIVKMDDWHFKAYTDEEFQKKFEMVTEPKITSVATGVPPSKQMYRVSGKVVTKNDSVTIVYQDMRRSYLADSCKQAIDLFLQEFPIHATIESVCLM